ncbi:hypothetical protein HGRIS_013663 [Hohenbuehelia grisea]|uniref:Uncharacterized protein n=1 Tax=Hohenbuehelia grisea TaxID=104357 RepID=A0ABR3IW94_9AGAR
MSLISERKPRGTGRRWTNVAWARGASMVGWQGLALKTSTFAAAQGSSMHLVMSYISSLLRRDLTYARHSVSLLARPPTAIHQLHRDIQTMNRFSGVSLDAEGCLSSPLSHLKVVKPISSTCGLPRLLKTLA